LNETEGSLRVNIPPDSVNPQTEDDIWANITFHCLGEGVSEINVSSIETIWLQEGEGEPFGVDPAPYSVVCNQTSAPTPETPEIDAVGGELQQSNTRTLYTLLILAMASTILMLIKKRGKCLQCMPTYPRTQFFKILS
jgi:hypothetical protein